MELRDLVEDFYGIREVRGVLVNKKGYGRCFVARIYNLRVMGWVFAGQKWDARRGFKEYTGIEWTPERRW